MTVEQKEKIIAFLQDQIAQAPFRIKAYVFDEKGKKNPTRNAFVKLKMHVNNYLQGKAEIRWLVMSGLRGAGKTTLLAQLYQDTPAPQNRKLFLSIDQVTQTFGVSLLEILNVYEELIGTTFERLDEPVFLFLDEVQYDKQWATLLKTIYDRSKKVFIIVTGSSALMLQASPDVARRTIYEKLFPMSFTEYMKIKQNKYEIKDLCKKLRTAVFNSSSAEEVYSLLKTQEKQVRQYWTGIERLEIDRYMQYGTLPFMVALKNEALVYDQIKKTLDRVVSNDIPQIGQFTSDILMRIPMILYAVADSEQLSLNSLTKSLEMSRPTLINILETLVKTETLIRIYPHGSHMSQSRKPSKYLFASPAFRSMYFNFIGSIHKRDNYKGKLLEDTVGLYLNRLLFSRSNTSLTYDNVEGGADFIVRLGNDYIIIEAGYGEKGFKQVAATGTRIPSRYGLNVSMSPLKISDNKKYVNVPLSYFLLM